jgi:hypothetical protein
MTHQATPAALPAATVAQLRTLADFDEQLLGLTLSRLRDLSQLVLERIEKRPLPLKIPARKALSSPAHDRVEALQWELYLELDWLGAVAQAVKRAPRGRRKSKVSALKGGGK